MSDETPANLVEGIEGAGNSNALNWFTPSAAAILIVTGAAKVWTAFGGVGILTVADPIVGIPFKHLMLGVGLVEIAVALVCCLGNRQMSALPLLAWLSTSFVVYRLGLWWMGWHRPCNCLGNFTDALHISPQVADNIMKVVLAYLLIGSYGLLVWEWRTRRRSALARQGKAETRSPELGTPVESLPMEDS